MKAVGYPLDSDNPGSEVWAGAHAHALAGAVAGPSWADVGVRCGPGGPPHQAICVIRTPNLLSAGSQRVNVTTQSANAVAYSLRADSEWVKLSATNGATSASAPGSFQISVAPGFFKKPGAYQTTVTITSGSAPPQFVNVHVIVTADRSDVMLSVSPNPVVGSDPDADGARWTFQLRLDERGGKAATRVTSLRINAVDYSGKIADWFGTDRLAAGGAIEATLRAANLNVPAEMFIEVGGADDTTGETWYRTLSVPFW